MKNIIITSGPTNERIDAVMKITNMSTGALGSIFADTLLEKWGDEIGKIYYIAPKLCYRPKTVSDKIISVVVDSTDDLINALRDICSRDQIDIVIHSAAVGDYKGDYVVRAEDLVKEIVEYCTQEGTVISEENLMRIFRAPKAVCDDETKISSYEPNLMVKLGLTTKVIGLIKKMAPHAKLVGFKLLEGVSKEELFNVASKLLRTNNADYIVANDLSKIGKGKHWAMILDRSGVVKECHTKKEIAESVGTLLFNRLH